MSTAKSLIPEQPGPGDTLTFDGKTYTFEPAGTLECLDPGRIVYIGKDVVETRTNFLIMSVEGEVRLPASAGVAAPTRRTSMKMMDIREFTDEGYLQEVNRQFLHPLGLALVVEADLDTGDERLCGVWDARDDPEGIAFTGPRDVSKANRIYVRGRLMATAREEALGYVVQPLRDGGRHVVTPSATDLVARLQGVANASSTREAGEAMQALIADGWDEGWLESI